MKEIKILLCPFDNGIRSMLRFKRGITGAYMGPQAVYEKLKSSGLKFEEIPLQKYNTDVINTNIFDVEFRKLQKKNTIQAHKVIEKYIYETKKSDCFPITVGGDHSITYPLVKGISKFYKDKRIGLIYIDAHFDMRPFDDDPDISGVISSGNAFKRIIEDDDINISGENIAAIGIHNSGSDNFKSLNEYATSKNLKIFFDSQITDIAATIEETMKHICKNTDIIYISIDIDAVDQKYAPGVSAPAVQGISEDMLLELVTKFISHPNLKGIDITEISNRQTAWYEILEKRKRDETEEEKDKKLDKTAELGAKLIRNITSVLKNEK